MHSKSITLYHYTNSTALKCIETDCVIGTIKANRLRMIDYILFELRIPEDKRLKYIENNKSNILWDIDYVSGWLLPKFGDYEKSLANNYGECYGRTIESAVKYAARVLKTPYREIRERVYQLYWNKNPVYIKIEVPHYLVHNLNDVKEAIKKKNNIEVLVYAPLPIFYIKEIGYL